MEVLEAHHMMMNVVIVKGPVLVVEVMRSKKVLDMIKKVGSTVILREVLLALKLSMIGVEMIDLEMVGDMMIVEYPMEILNWTRNHLNDQEI